MIIFGINGKHISIISSFSCRMRSFKQLCKCPQIRSWWYVIMWIILIVCYTPFVYSVIKLKGISIELVLSIESAYYGVLGIIFLLCLVFMIPSYFFPRYIPTAVTFVLYTNLDANSLVHL